jgi:hypothetical protein
MLASSTVGGVSQTALRIWMRPLALGSAVFVALSVGFHFNSVDALTVATLTSMSIRLADRRTHRTL